MPGARWTDDDILTALRMREDRNASHHEIAEKLGRSIAAVEKMLRAVERDLKDSEEHQ